MKTFKTKGYEIRSEKIQDTQGVSFAVLTDLHGAVYGKENQLLLSAVDKSSPDAVLVLGDMIVRRECGTMEDAERLLLALAKRCPVYYALGNHEFKLLCRPEDREEYLSYEKRLSEGGVRFLHNESCSSLIRGTRFVFHGLELPLAYYHKPNSPRLTPEKLEGLLGTPSEEGVHVLLAHSPKYGKTYFSWGADLILSGHYHGGILRFSEHHGLTSPQFLLFPPYCCGDFHKGGRHMFVSAGLGEHTVPLRIHNPRELLIITMKPLEKSEYPG